MQYVTSGRAEDPTFRQAPLDELWVRVLDVLFLLQLLQVGGLVGDNSDLLVVAKVFSYMLEEGFQLFFIALFD